MVRALLTFVSLLILSGYAAAAPVGNNSGFAAAPSGQQSGATSRRWSYDQCYATYRERSDAIGQALTFCKEECTGAGNSPCKVRCIAEFSRAMSLLGDSTKRCLCRVYVENTLLSYLESDPRFGRATPQEWNQQRKLLNDQCIARPPAEFK